MLRNKELRQFAAVFALIAGISAAVGFGIGWEAGWLALGSAAAFGAAFFAFTWARYRRIARLSEQIDQVLHSAGSLDIAQAEEGELAVLQSEISKMTLRIREQNDALRREKAGLADSMADIAHQLRTPLTSANLILTLLKAGPDEAERQALLRELAALLARMDWLVTALLKLSRLDAGIVVFQKQPVRVQELVRAAARPLLIAMELHGVTLEQDVPEDAVILGDAGWLAEALQNILKNCMEGTGDGGRITAACRDTLLFTELTVRDSGPGFAKEDLPHLFDRFYRGRDAGQAGYGIGLALCRSIILRQGGTVTAKNHPQGGALFIIRFPK